MLPILAGALVFPLLLAGDYAGMRGVRPVRLACLLAGVILAACAVTAGLLDPPGMRVGTAVRTISGAAGAFFLFLLVWSYLIEIPAAPSWLGIGRAKILVTTGTYALSRHPGVIWFFFLTVFLALARGSLLLLIAAAIWSGLNVLYAAVLDRFIFPRVFGEAWSDYRQRVPFLIPTSESLRECLATCRPARRKEWPQQ